MGRQAHAVSADVADDEAVERAAQEIESALGPIELWVNSAFTGAIAFFGDVRPEEYRRITDVTYMGFVNGTHAALKRMQPRNRGRVIQVGSALAFRGIPLQSAYCGAKHAIKGFTESVRVELKHQGCKVRLCDIQMPGVNTPQFDWVLHRGVDHHRMPVPPIYRPEVCARAVVHVAEHPRLTMWVGLPTALTILATGSRRRCWTGTWPRPTSRASSRPTMTRRGSSTTPGSRCTEPRSPRTAASTTRPTPAAPSCGLVNTAGCCGAGAAVGVGALAAAAGRK